MLNEFINFDKMISAALIRIYFKIGLAIWALIGVFCLLGGLAAMTQQFLAGVMIIAASVVLTFCGALCLRVACEIAIVLFLIHDNLTGIKENTRQIAP